MSAIDEGVRTPAQARIAEIVRAMHLAPWHGEEAALLHSTAAQCFLHNHPRNRQDAATVRGCQACCLLGMLPHKDGSPNVAGWHRMYIQTGRRLPLGLLEAALLKHRNSPYGEALARDIMTWGVPKEGPINGSRNP